MIYVVTIVMFIMVLGRNLGEWCKWGTCNELNEQKGPIYEAIMDRNKME